jgi:hypothetical protein
LRGLLAHLGFEEAGGFHLLGHSWEYRAVVAPFLAEHEGTLD